LINTDKIQEKIEEGIKREESIENVGWCVSYIARASKKVAQKLANGIGH